MKYAGHTMGTPDLNLLGSMQLFSEIGFDGIEIRCALDGQLDPECVRDRYIEKTAEWCREYDLSIACLTSYYRDFVTKEAGEELSRLRKVIDIAMELECPNVRLYGGMDPSTHGITHEENWQASVKGTRELADYSADRNVRLCVETHIGSLTMTARQTARFIGEVDRPNVGVLLDFAWVFYAGEESVAEVFELLEGKIYHCHVKDWHIRSSSDNSKNVACLLGQGDIPWNEFLRALKASGYDGWITDEYERYWHADQLPQAREGMRANLSFLRGALG